MLEHALILDAKGKPMKQHQRAHSTDWDEVRAFCDACYGSYHVEPLGQALRPNATLYSTKVGRVIATRFGYGVPVQLKDFDLRTGNIVALTTLRGNVKHGIDLNKSAITGPRESFVVDCSRTDYWLDGDEYNLQFNLTIPHNLMENTALNWFGFIPNDRLWKFKTKFGGSGSAWVSLLDYIAKAVAEIPDRTESGRIAAHLEQMICVGLLTAWAGHADVDLEQGARSAAPYYVRRAEMFMEENARSLPTLTEVASATGVSVRALSGAFCRFRNMTPMAFLREQRLQGIRKDLLTSPEATTVSAIASSWGYFNFGVFAKSYKKRFGELPSETLKRARYWRLSSFPSKQR